ncbi:hypothetical protein Y032_0001g142 [Ancylostoma ceylanicum]|uniref:Uncharacterized protein n=1 Tax=Ancylostoma ceylanicum TaxID=53326 RepID=A0A016W2K5_9BILA|nr:hypothetical protein Y032_0001g142 [Ancylostoma ceylanicum]
MLPNLSKLLCGAASYGSIRRNMALNVRVRNVFGIRTLPQLRLTQIALNSQVPPVAPIASKAVKKKSWFFS